MSRMEVFFGAFEKSDLQIEPSDTDEFYDLEIELGKHFVKVDGQLYAFWKIQEVEPEGFTLTIPQGFTEFTYFLAYWYNGGAGIHEVVEDIIKGSYK